jgi:hypothetical protein
MTWRNCTECGWSYNDKLGGCTNKACKNYNTGIATGTQPTQSVPSMQRHSGSAGITLKKPLAPPAFSPSPLMAQSVSVANPVTFDAAILPWVNPQAAVKGTPLAAEPFRLVCYRGEKSEWWPPPRMRLAPGGMNVFEPWSGQTIADIWKKLVELVGKEPGFNVKQKVAAYAQYLRAEGRPFALASARTTAGSFVGYSYVIEIPNARTFRWGKDCTLGPPANFKDTTKTTYERVINQNVETFTKDTIDADYIVLNADTIADSTILGFGHMTGTYEVTFLHDLPLSFVKTVDGVAPNALQIYTEEALKKLPDTKEKQTALKLLRKS